MSTESYKWESLKLSFERDPVTHLPLLSEAGTLLGLTLNYLPLPHSVVEYGCGKKASLILDLLAGHGVPVHGLKRGLILESDMSPEALARVDHHSRPHALTVPNPLHARADLQEKSLRGMLRDEGFEVEQDRPAIIAGPFELHHVEVVQFAIARSHIYSIVTFWDPDERRAVDRVIDPTLDRTRLFPVGEMRSYLHGPEALLFSAPMLGHFRLDPAHLTAAQEETVRQAAPDGCVLASFLHELSHTDHARLVRRLTGAAVGSIGDPETWSYANNIRPSGDHAHDDRQTANTGLGDELRVRMRQLREARRTEPDDEVRASRKLLRESAVDLEVRRRMKRDAIWSGRHLVPLARLAATVSSHRSLSSLADVLRNGGPLPADPTDPSHLRRFRGLAVRLRQRIEHLALASTDEDGRINACALTPPFNEAAAETIRQMNHAGLTVFIDRVGNLHGLRLTRDEVAALRSGELRFEDVCKDAVCHASHIDTVSDAGKHDGRLGVMAGIEIARTVHDLATHFGVSLGGDRDGARVQVSAFMAEEMTFSGEGVAMPGSSAVAGLAKVDAVHRMTDREGTTFAEGLHGMLQFLEKRRREGDLRFWNRFPARGSRDEWFAACPEPAGFFTPHTYERHIEQGPELDRAGIPLVLVDRIMGIRQEDFSLEGEAAAAAALELSLRLRELATSGEFGDLRVTAGIMEETARNGEVRPAGAWRCRFSGEENHAGSTPMGDRHDAGTAAARVARGFRELVGAENMVVSSPTLEPGTNRNVVPGSATVTLATRKLPPGHDRDGIAKWLMRFTGPDAEGPGDDVLLEDLQAVETITLPSKVRLAIDLRAPEVSLLQSFRDRMSEELESITDFFGVRGAGEVRQQVAPLSLDRSGQVLQLERSYGGSHNPNEAELAVDLLRGTVVQLAVTHAFQTAPRPLESTLYALARHRIPGPWKKQLPGFTSGALHDTCSIAARMQER